MTGKQPFRIVQTFRAYRDRLPKRRIRVVVVSVIVAAFPVNRDIQPPLQQTDVAAYNIISA